MLHFFLQTTGNSPLSFLFQLPEAAHIHLFVARSIWKASKIVYQSCHNKGPQNGWLKITGIYGLIILQARGLTSRCWQGWLFLRAERENLFMPLSQLLGVCRYLCTLRLSDASLQFSTFTWRSPCVTPHRLPSVHVSLCPNFPFLYGHQSRYRKTHPGNLILT